MSTQRERPLQWWELAAPLELAVRQRMGLEYGILEPGPDARIVEEEEEKLKRGEFDTPQVAVLAEVWRILMLDEDDDEEEARG